MPNLYGVDNSPLNPQLTSLGSLLTVNAGVETTFLSMGPLTAVSPGVYFPMFWGFIYVSLFATPPSALQFNAKIGGGSAFDIMVVPAVFLTASASMLYQCCFLGTGSEVPWRAPGSTVNFTCNSTGQNTNINTAYTRIMGGLFRAQDQ